MNKQIFLIIALLCVNLCMLADEYRRAPARPCCTYQNGKWHVGGYDESWWNRYYPGSWERFGVGTAWDGKTPFVDKAEQPDISGFERSVYTSPK